MANAAAQRAGLCEGEAGAECVGGPFNKWVRDRRQQLGIAAAQGAYRFVNELFDRYGSHYTRLRQAATIYERDPSFTLIL
jgi:hypothetical protein